MIRDTQRRRQRREHGTKTVKYQGAGFRQKSPHMSATSQVPFPSIPGNGCPASSLSEESSTLASRELDQGTVTVQVTVLSE